LVNLRISKSKPGIYPVTITGSTTSAGTQSHTFNVVVTTNTNCAAALAGDYTDVETNKSCTIKASGDKLLIPGSFGTDTVTAVLNCEARTLSVIAWKFTYGWFGGSRITTFNADSIHLEYTARFTGHQGVGYDDVAVKQTLKRKGH
jgi:hypothetical protein